VRECDSRWEATEKNVSGDFDQVGVDGVTDGVSGPNEMRTVWVTTPQTVHSLFFDHSLIEPKLYG
jgi:hypothetical protein